MAASLRPSATRLFMAIYRLASQPVHLSRPMCRVPPDDSEQAEEATATDKNVKAENLEKSQNIETQAEDHRPQQMEGLVKENAASKPSEASSESTGKEESAVEKQDKTSNKKMATQKLNDLLTSLATTDPIPVESCVQLSRPKARKKAKAADKNPPPTPPEPGLEPELVSATKEVAQSLGGDVKATESELLSTLRLHSVEASSRTALTVSELFVGMKVEKKPAAKVEGAPLHHDQDMVVSRPRHSRPRDFPQPRRTHPRPPASSIPRTRVDLFGAPNLGLFSNMGKETTSKSPLSSPLLPTWERLHMHELQQCVSHPPDNAFVEMIQWTNEGKLWTFPIDNEIGLEEEKKIGFHEHVFLERHLEGWCPQRGPIRHFMELVCTGLSKNPYLTVERKQAHIEWYKNYFAQKEGLLKELGAIEASQ